MGLIQPDGARQIMPGWYVLYQQATPSTGVYVDCGRLEVKVDPFVLNAKIETYYLNLDADTTGGGLPPATGGPGTEPRAIYQWPGSVGRTTDYLKLVQATGALGQPTGIRSSKIVCKCAAPVTVGP